jgi:hypothetical protein
LIRCYGLQYIIAEHRINPAIYPFLRFNLALLNIQAYVATSKFVVDSQIEIRMCFLFCCLLHTHPTGCFDYILFVFILLFISCEGPCLRSYHATIASGHPSGCRSLGFTAAQVEVNQHLFSCGLKNNITVFQKKKRKHNVCKIDSRLCSILSVVAAETGNIDVPAAG